MYYSLFNLIGLNSCISNNVEEEAHPQSTFPKGVSCTHFIQFGSPSLLLVILEGNTSSNFGSPIFYYPQSGNMSQISTTQLCQH